MASRVLSKTIALSSVKNNLNLTELLARLMSSNVSQPTNVGFIGLGNMGAHMARNLANKVSEIYVHWNGIFNPTNRYLILKIYSTAEIMLDDWIFVRRQFKLDHFFNFVSFSIDFVWNFLLFQTEIGILLPLVIELRQGELFENRMQGTCCQARILPSLFGSILLWILSIVVQDITFKFVIDQDATKEWKTTNKPNCECFHSN